MKKFFKILVLIVIILSIIGTFIFLYEKSKPEVMTYELVSPVQKDIKKVTVISGNIDPRDEVNIKPQISGIIDEIYKKAGDSVKKGDIIAKVKVIPELGQLNSAESRLRLAKISFTQIEKEHKRIEKLHNEKLVSDEEYEKSLTNYNRQKEELSSSKDALSIVKDGITENSKSISNTLVRSTIDGLILDIPVKKGNSVILSNTFNDGTTIATVANMNDLIFRGNVDETEVGNMQEGMGIILTIGALPEERINAILEYISPKGVSVNGTTQYEIKAAVELPDGIFLRAGYSASGEVLLKEQKNALALPERCIEFRGDSTFVYVEVGSASGDDVDDQKFERRAIKLGVSDGLDVAVNEGLSSKDKVRGAMMKASAKNRNKSKHGGSR